MIYRFLAVMFFIAWFYWTFIGVHKLMFPFKNAHAITIKDYRNWTIGVVILAVGSLVFLMLGTRG